MNHIPFDPILYATGRGPLEVANMSGWAQATWESKFYMVPDFMLILHTLMQLQVDLQQAAW